MNAPSVERVGLFVLLCAGAAVSLCGWRRSGPFAVALAVLVGASERIRRPFIVDGSDVDDATMEALGLLLGGQNPYAGALQSTLPPGAPFVYGPGELLFYLPARVLFDDISRVETWAGILTVAVIGLIGRRVGFGRVALPAMLYATWGIAAFRTTDGGNDVAAALVTTAGIASLALSGPDRAGRIAFYASAVLFGWSLAFKQFVVLLIPLVLRHLAVAGAPWRRFVLVVAGTTAVFDLPFVLWDAGAFLLNQTIAPLRYHAETWGANLPATLERLDPRLAEPTGAYVVAQLACTLLALGAFLRWRIPTLGGAVICGAGVIAIPLFLARWTTQSYYVYAATLALAGLALLEERVTTQRRAVQYAQGE